MPLRTRFTGPHVHVLAVRNQDQSSRYPFTDPTTFLDRVKQLWGGGLVIDLIDETDDVRHVLEGRLDDVDVLWLLSNAPHHRAVCEALCQCRDLVGDWLNAGGALFILHTTTTHRADFLPESVAMEFLPLEAGADEQWLRAGDHPMLTMPFDSDEALTAEHIVHGYRRRYCAVGGALAATASVVVTDQDGPAMLAADVGYGRVVLSPLILDWHGHAALAVNALCWATRSRVVEVAGEATALLPLPATGRTSVGVVARDNAGLSGEIVGIARHLTLGGEYRIELSAEHALRVTSPDVLKLGIPALRSRMEAGLWGTSVNQTVQTCRYLAQCGALDAFPEAVDRLLECRDATMGDTFVAKLDALVLATKAPQKSSLARRRAAIREAVATELAHRPIEVLRPDGARTLLALTLAGEHALAASRVEELTDVIASGPGAQAGTAAALHQSLRDLGTLRLAERLFDAKPPTGWPRQHPVVTELLRSRPASAAVLDFLEIAAEGRPRANELAVPAGAFDSLLVYAYSELRSMGAIESAPVLARHMAFWSGYPALANRAARLTATAVLLERPSAPIVPLDVERDQLRERVQDAFDLLEIPTSERRMDRTLLETLTATPSGGLARAAIRVAGVPLLRLRPFADAVSIPLVGVGGIALLPLFSKDALQAFITASDGVRWPIVAVCGAIVAAIIATTPVCTRHVLVPAAILLGWMTAVFAFATSTFAADVRKWQHGADLLDSSTLHRVEALLHAGVLPWSVLIVVASTTLARRLRPR